MIIIKIKPSSLPDFKVESRLGNSEPSRAKSDASLEEQLKETERDIIQRTVDSLTAAGRDALSSDDFIDARARHLADQNVPLVNSYFVGGGINGWRRACLVLLRKLYGKVQKQQTKKHTYLLKLLGIEEIIIVFNLLVIVELLFD